MPNISIGSWAFAFGPYKQHPWTNRQVLAFVADAGFDGIELNGFRPHPIPDDFPTAADRVALRQEFVDFGLRISGYAPDFTSVPPAEVETERYLDLLHDYIEFCHDLDTSVIRVDTVSPPKPLWTDEYEQRFAQLVKTWQAASRLAESEGIRIVWEFEPGFWLNKPSEVLRVVESVGNSSFGVLFDTSHAYISGVIGARQTGPKETLPGGVEEYYRMLQPYIGHLHLIDSDGTLHDEDTSTHARLGAGYIDFQKFLSTFREDVLQFPWWCVDYCFNPDVETLAKEAVPFVKARIREIEG